VTAVKAAHAAPRSRLRVNALRAMVAALTVAALQVSTGTAVADVVQDARTRATALRAQVDALRVKAEVAAESYNAAQASVDDVVGQYLQGEDQLAALQKRADDDRSLAAGRIVALYQSGGVLGIYSNVLSGEGVVDIYDRIQMARTVISGDQSVISDSTASLAAVTAQQNRLSDLHDKQIALEREASKRADAARTATDKAEGLLAAADGDVQRLVLEQQAAAAKAEAEAFARSLAAARAAAEQAATTLPTLHDAGQPTSIATAAIAAARTRIGVPYVWGATGPNTFDCSGLTQWAYAQAGLALPRTAQQQWFAGRHVSLAELAPGDLLFWAYDVKDPSTIHHVAIYVGNGRMIAAPHTGAFVQEQDVFGDGFVGAVRPSG
jgi:cell wall-associated NlpC family hydrolase